MRPLVPVLVLVSFVSSGCSFAGYCIGANIPRYERHPVSASSLRWEDEIHRGEEIGYRAKGNATVWRSGTFEGIDDDTLAITTNDGPDRIPLADIDEVRVRRGSEWATGTLVGALVDAIVVGFIVASLAGNSHVDIGP